MKKILFLIVVLLFCVQITNVVQAAEGGYFNNVPLRNLSGTAYLTQATDNNNETKLNIRYSAGIPIYEFKENENVVKYYYEGEKGVCINLFSDVNQYNLVATILTKDEGWNDLSITNIRTIFPSSCGNSSDTYFSELDFITESQLIVRDVVTNVKLTSEFDNIKATWKLPEEAQSTNIFLNGVKVDNTTATTYQFTNLEANKKYKVELEAVYDKGFASKVATEIVTKDYPEFSSEYVGVYKVTDSSIILDLFVNQMNVKPNFIYVFVDGEPKGQLTIIDKKKYQYTINDLNQEQEYKIEIKAKFNNYLTSAVSKNIATTVGSKEVKEIKAIATYKQVNLSWEIPSYSKFNVVRIYRNEVGSIKNKTAAAGTFAATEIFDPLFETNGTSFKDLTVKANTTYRYKLTTEDINGNETAGEIISVKTPQIAVTNADLQKNDDNYRLTWQEPDKGKLLIKVGGNDYKTVNAIDKYLDIPLKDMKYDMLNNPDITIVVLDDNNNPVSGSATKPGNSGIGMGGISLTSLNLTPKELMIAVAALLGLVGGIVLLAMSFRVAPKIIDLISNAFK